MRIFQAYYNSLDFSEKKRLRILLSEQCGVSNQCIWAWVRGSRFPKKSTQKIIAEVIGINHNKLFPNVLEMLK